MQGIEESYEVHLHFWIKFTDINFERLAASRFGVDNKPSAGDANNAINYEICFLGFGDTEKSKNLTFS